MTEQETPAPTPSDETTEAPQEQPAAAAEETPASAPAEKSEPKAKESKPAAKSAKTPKAPKGPGGTPPDGHWWWGTGRRKTAVARVRIRPGDGKFIVNKKPHSEYFNEERDRNDIMNVLEKTSAKGGVDVHVNVHGGGFMGQAGAIVLGLARALRKYDETLEPILRSNAFLSRDPRKVERKKYGQRGARRKFQFSKR